MKKGLIAVLSILVLSISGISYAVPLTLTSGNSSVTIDPATQSGAYDWRVDGQDHLYQQWFWYRVGGAGGESSINNISAPVVSLPSPDIVRITYSNPSLFSVSVLYTLTGGTAGSSTSDLAETILISNLSGSSLNFHFFQYSDFDLGGAAGDTARLVNANTVQQFDPNVIFSETVVTPPADRYQISPYSQILGLLNDGAPTTLNNFAGPLSGDMTWAFQWDRTIAAGGSFIISKDKNLTPVPEPLSLILLGCGMVGLIELRRRIKK